MYLVLFIIMQLNMWKISCHVRRAHLGKPTCRGKLETIKGLTKASRRKKGEYQKPRKTSQTQKQETLGQGRAQFPIRGSVTKEEG